MISRVSRKYPFRKTMEKIKGMTYPMEISL